MSLPDDYDSDNDSGNSSVGPYTKRLGKRELRASKEDSGAPSAWSWRVL